MRIGIVCPYSFDVPGGVQFHVRDLAEALQRRGHEVSVLAPADDDTPIPEYMTSAGRAIPVRYNGSVARTTFGPLAAAKVRRWLQAGQFDILHLHEPVTPSVGMLALWIAQGPIVATFHSSLTRSRALQVAYPFVRQSLEKIDARIAVSEDARRTLIDHLGGDAVVIPNGVDIARFADAAADSRWTGTLQAPTIAFLGRLDEPRKGLPVLTQAISRVVQHIPEARFIIAGRGDEGQAEAVEFLGELQRNVEFLGGISDADKAALLSSVDLYIAPQTGGESFGIVLVEAMSAGACVVASDLGAFRRVLHDGKAGALFPVGDAVALAETILALLRDPAQRAELQAYAAHHVQQFDWSIVTADICAVYDTVRDAVGLAPVAEDPRSRRPLRRRNRAVGAA